MNTFPLSPFLEALAGDGIRPTLHDYERISMALQAQVLWTLSQLRDVLLALLVRNEDQQDIFIRRFEEFFDSDIQIKKKFEKADIDKILADLQQLAKPKPFIQTQLGR